MVLTIAAGGLSGGAAFAGTGPSPVVVTCGEVITASITVANNLTCPGNALIVGADGVTLDLGGHTVRGGGSGVGVQIADDNPQISGVTVTNGAISHFGSAIQLSNADGATLSGLLLADNSGTAAPVIDTGRFPISTGLAISDTRITHTSGNVIFAQINVGPVTIADSRIAGGSVFFSQSVGPTFTGDSFANTDVTFNIEGGTTVTGSTFVDSPVVDNGFGFGNDVFHANTFSGVTTGTALTLADVANQQVTGNTFANNDIGVSISDSPGDTVSGNVFSHNRTAGVYFVDSGPMPHGTLAVSGNKATGNGDSPDGATDPGGLPVEGGIYLYTPHGGASITDNHTAHDGGYGIYALPPAPGSPANASSGNVSVSDFARCYPLNLCAYQ
jgi:parallel beta-helix repeat protein